MSVLFPFLACKWNVKFEIQVATKKKKKTAQGEGIFQETENPPSSCTPTLPGVCARVSKGCFSLEITTGMFSLHQKSCFPLGIHEQVDHQPQFAMGDKIFPP